MVRLGLGEWGVWSFKNLFWTNLKTHSLKYEDYKILCNNYFPWKNWEERKSKIEKKLLYT